MGFNRINSNKNKNKTASWATLRTWGFQLVVMDINIQMGSGKPQFANSVQKKQLHKSACL